MRVPYYFWCKNTFEDCNKKQTRMMPGLVNLILLRVPLRRTRGCGLIPRGLPRRKGSRACLGVNTINFAIASHCQPKDEAVSAVVAATCQIDAAHMKSGI